jgi:putative flippase GtrA
MRLTAQLRRFLITGFSATLIDLSFYSLFLYLLRHFWPDGLHIDADIPLQFMSVGLEFMFAKVGSFMCAVIFAYHGHRSWTFMSHGSKKRATAFMTLYVSALVINATANSSILAIVGTEITGIATAFVIATGFTATINFVVMKFFIFRPAKVQATST